MTRTPTKAEMLKTMASATKRLQRMRKAGLTRGHAYRQAISAITAEARRRGKTQYSIRRGNPKMTITAGRKETKAELWERYKIARDIMNEPLLTTGYVHTRQFKQKKATFQRRYGFPKTDDATFRSFLEMLGSDEFKAFMETTGFDSRQVVELLAEHDVMEGNTLMTAINDFMEYKSSMGDRFFYDEFEDVIKALGN